MRAIEDKLVAISLWRRKSPRRSGLGKPGAAHHRQPEKRHEKRREPKVPDSAVNGARLRSRQRRIERAHTVEAKEGGLAAIGVEHGGDAVIAVAHQRQALLHGAGPGDREMLVWARAVAVPGIVRDIEQPVRTVLLVHDGARKDRFVADQRTEWRDTGHGDGAGAIAGREIDGSRGDLLERQDGAQRYIFTERHEMRLVVGGDDAAAAVDRLEAVPHM